MIDRSKQIIPDSQAVVKFLDAETLKILDLHSTFILNELLESVKKLTANNTTLELSKTRITNIFNAVGSNGNYDNDSFFDALKQTITAKDKTSRTIVQQLIDGTYCNLLNSDGKGWQKGKLKMCFEFIPDEPEPLATEEKPLTAHLSPLDEIRQLSNELASAKATEQN